MASNVNRIIKNTGYLYLNMALSMFVSLYSTRIILNTLGVSDFGIFTIIGGAIGILGFLNGSLSGAITRFINYAEGSGKQSTLNVIFNTSVFIQIILSGVLIIGFSTAYHIFFNGLLNIEESRQWAAKWIYIFMATSTIITVQTMPYNAIINAHENMKVYSYVGMVFTLLKLAIALYIAHTDADKLIMYGLLMAFLTIVNTFVIRFYCHHKYSECALHLRKNIDFKLAKRMLSFASFNMLTTLTSMFAVYGSNIVVNNFFGTAINAAQGVASQVSGQLMVFSNNMLMAVKPVIGKKSGSQDFTSMIRIAFSSSKLSFFILFFFACPFIIEANWILNIWLKEVPEWAITFCRLELLRRLLSQLTDSLKECIQAEGHIKSYSMQQSIFHVIHLPIVGILFYLGYSVIWLYIINIITLNFIAGYNVVHYAQKNCHMNISQYCKDVVLRSFTACLPPVLCGLLIHQLLPNSFYRTIIVSLVTSIITFVSVRFIGLTTNEINLFNGLTVAVKQRFFSFIPQRHAQ